MSCAAICPSFHASNISEATYEQLRPEDEAAMTDEKRMGRAAVHALIQFGTPVSHVADSLFAGIEAGQHYIHTHDDVSLAFAKDRFENIIEHKAMVGAHTEQMMMRLMQDAMAKAAAAAAERKKRTLTAKL